MKFWYLWAILVVLQWGIITLQRAAYRRQLALYHFRLARLQQVAAAARATMTDVPDAAFLRQMEAVFADIERRQAGEAPHGA